MDKSFQQLIQEIIERKYTLDSQHNARVILNAYYSQASDQRRSLTLEALGELPGLSKKLTRERARQILKKFRAENLKREIKLLERGESIDDLHMLSIRKDLSELRNTIEKIVEEIESFPKPIFSYRMQERLLRKGLIDNSIFLPVIAELAESFSIPTTFKIEEFKGNRIILDENMNLSGFTKDILSFAGGAATHLGGTCSFEALIGPEWGKGRPASIESIDSEVRLKYLYDILNLDEDLMFLQNESYFSFKDRDERLSTILSEIFKVYTVAIDKDILIGALVTSLTHRFMTEKKSSEREQKIYLVEKAKDAFDEFCIRTLLLDKVEGDKRKPGVRLISMLEDKEPSVAYKSQAMLVEAIRSKGAPVNSKEFGVIYRIELGLPESHKSICYSYPTLYYKEGNVRKNNYYKTLDGLYSISTSDSHDWKPEFDRSKLRKIQDEIETLQKNYKEIDEDSIPSGDIRKEQGLLRRYLIEASDSVEMSNGDKSCKCLLCNRYLSSNLLVAAHVKKRALCTAQEKADIKNIAMLQCGGCDKLFENGYVYIDEAGTIKINENAPLTNDIKEKLYRLDGNKTEYFTDNSLRSEYLKHHRERALEKY